MIRTPTVLTNELTYALRARHASPLHIVIRLRPGLRHAQAMLLEREMVAGFRRRQATAAEAAAAAESPAAPTPLDQSVGRAGV